MDPITKIHSKIYDFLQAKRIGEPTLFFTFRKSNRDNRLGKGYWFYGNEGYLAVSFWSGMDWKNKTPNIIFVILESGETYLEVSTSDSDEKRDFVVNYLVKELNLISKGQRYRRYYHGKDYIESLEDFLATDKKKIDSILSKNAPDFFKVIENGIYFIDDTTFNAERNKIEEYRLKLINEKSRTINLHFEESFRISKFLIKNFGPIHEVKVDHIPYSSQWIFFTGENGTGKTSILRSITTALTKRKIENIDDSFVVQITLHASNQDEISFERRGNEVFEGRSFIDFIGFAAYGQSRLKISHSTSPTEKMELNDSLFRDDASLYNFQLELEGWKNDPNFATVYDERKTYIKEMLVDIVPNLYDIDFGNNEDNSTINYVERDSENGQYNHVSFEKLASGMKSMIAMVGDILIRFYHQQPDVYDPSEFKGVVFIDEIDIHLHPKLQREIVVQLTKTFPNIQFVVTTHSPIPLLGAPRNSKIFNVARTVQRGVELRQIDDKLELGDLLPNTILTSPIFGLEDIVPESHDRKHIVRTETTYQEIEFNDKVSQRINEFFDDTKEKRLIELFKLRRK